LEPIALLIGLAVAAAACYANYKYLRGDGRDVVRLAEDEFRQILISEAPPAFCFDGRSAEIVVEAYDYQDKYQTRVVCVRRYARNACGEYFFFLSEGTGRPYFKHIEQVAAKAALGRRYVPPQSDS